MACWASRLTNFACVRVCPSPYGFADLYCFSVDTFSAAAVYRNLKVCLALFFLFVLRVGDLRVLCGGRVVFTRFSVEQSPILIASARERGISSNAGH